MIMFVINHHDICFWELEATGSVSFDPLTGPVDSLPQPVLSSSSTFSKLASYLIPFVMDALYLQSEATGN